ncbi:hypothetical protein CHARACLAT_020413 [Characodon lateralis]|uniref:Uncharacterized protein n=1 Tax=Characodon lateralis TaxID=208331 RepID=A0ABU7EKX0_9TELE|nr:hypothetical protein [Characodon lateralis]
MLCPACLDGNGFVEQDSRICRTSAPPRARPCLCSAPQSAVMGSALQAAHPATSPQPQQRQSLFSRRQPSGAPSPPLWEHLIGDGKQFFPTLPLPLESRSDLAVRIKSCDKGNPFCFSSLTTVEAR